MRAFVFLVLFLLPAQAFAQTVLSINAEWFWDDEEPHEGQVAFGAIGSPPTATQVNLEAYALALVIKNHNADIVGLVEVEDKPVVERVRGYLGDDWKVVFKKGRDSYTGQDVALLTRFNVNQTTVTNFPDIKGESGTVKARPSKVLGVGLENNGKSYFVVVTHLISKRSSNDNKRAAQADAIRQAVMMNKGAYDHMIVMGDLNDELGSATLNTVLEAGLKAASTSANYSFVHEGKRQLIDHILVEQENNQTAIFFDYDLGPISDHRGVGLVLK